MTRRTAFRHAFVSSAVLTFSVGSATAQQSQHAIRKLPRLSAAQWKLAHDLFAKAKAAREALRSGNFEAAATDGGSPVRQNRLISDARLVCAFDYDKQQLRYDFNHDKERMTVRYFSRPKRSAVYQPAARGGFLTIGTPAQMLKNWPRVKRYNLDVRGMGLLNPHEQRSGWDFDQAVSFHKSYARLVDVRREANSQYRLVFRHVSGPRGLAERHVWIDPSKGYVPVRFQQTYRSLTDKNSQWKVMSTVDATWTQKNDVWVPASFEALTSEGRSYWKLEFTWKSVNKGVPNKLLNVRDLNVDPNARVRYL